MKIIVVILNIYGALSILLLFCNHQDTESEAQEMTTGVAGTILEQKKHQRPYGTTISIPFKIGKSFVVISHIYSDRHIFYYFMVTKTLILSHKK